MNIIEAHKFFCYESRKFVGVFKPVFSATVSENGKFVEKTFGRYEYRIKDIVRFPIAYCKFMRHYLLNWG